MPWKSGNFAASLVLYVALGVLGVWTCKYYWEEAYPWEGVTVAKIVSKREFILSDGRHFFWTYPKEVVRPHDRSMLFLNKFLAKLTAMAGDARRDDPDAVIPPFNAVIPNTHQSTDDIYAKEIYFLVLHPDQMGLSDQPVTGLMNIRTGQSDITVGPEYGYKLQDIMTANGVQVLPETP